MLRKFKITVKRVAVFILAVFGRVVPADLRSRFVDAAAIVGSKVFTNGVDQQEPIVVFSKDGRMLMEQIPAKVVKILGVCWPVDRQRKVPTTLGRAIFAEYFTGFEFVTLYLAW